MYKVNYLGHSGFTVETDNYFLVFDYVYKNKDVTLGVLDEIEQKQISIKNIGKTVIFFNSHDHFDHYNRDINNLYSKYNNAYTILGDISVNFANTKVMKNREVLEVKGVKVCTAKATDAGVCFLVNVDGIIIYFAGDNIDWGDEASKKLYYSEIDYLSSLAGHVDLAFIPVCNFYGEQSKSILDSAIYAIEKFNATETYPMHSPFGKFLYANFDKILKDRNVKTKVIIL